MSKQTETAVRRMVRVSDSASNRSSDIETAATFLFLAGGSIQFARLIKMNGKKRNHSALLAGPDVSPPHEKASVILGLPWGPSSGRRR
jgi:hypothetical protein